MYSIVPSGESRESRLGNPGSATELPTDTNDRKQSSNKMGETSNLKFGKRSHVSRKPQYKDVYRRTIEIRVHYEPLNSN